MMMFDFVDDDDATIQWMLSIVWQNRKQEKIVARNRQKLSLFNQTLWTGVIHFSLNLCSETQFCSFSLSAKTYLLFLTMHCQLE